MIKQKLASIVYEAICFALAAGQIELAEGKLDDLTVTIEQPNLPEHGDLSCPVAMQIAALAGTPQKGLDYACLLARRINNEPENLFYVKAASASAPGFINFGFGSRLGAEILLEIASLGRQYGCVPDQEQSHWTADQARSLEESLLTLAPVIYAFGRCASVLRQATEPRINILSGRMEAPIMTAGEWTSFLDDCKAKTELYFELDLFQNDQASSSSSLARSQTRLILKLAMFPEAAQIAFDYRQPDRLVRYSTELADELANFWRQFNLGEGFFNAQLSVLKARLGLILATRQVLGNALGIIDLPVLEQM